MNDSPSVVFAPKHHRYPQVESRLVRPTRNTKSNVLGLDEISELGPDRGPNFLSAACTFGKLSTSPVEPRCHFVPSRLHAPKSAADADVITVGPKRFKCGGMSLCKFKFCGLKFCDECGPF